MSIILVLGKKAWEEQENMDFFSSMNLILSQHLYSPTNGVRNASERDPAAGLGSLGLLEEAVRQ